MQVNRVLSEIRGNIFHALFRGQATRNKNSPIHPALRTFYRFERAHRDFSTVISPQIEENKLRQNRQHKDAKKFLLACGGPGGFLAGEATKWALQRHYTVIGTMTPESAAKKGLVWKEETLGAAVNCIRMERKGQGSLKDPVKMYEALSSILHQEGAIDLDILVGAMPELSGSTEEIIEDIVQPVTALFAAIEKFLQEDPSLTDRVRIRISRFGTVVATYVEALRKALSKEKFADFEKEFPQTIAYGIASSKADLLLIQSAAKLGIVASVERLGFVTELPEPRLENGVKVSVLNWRHEGGLESLALNGIGPRIVHELLPNLSPIIPLATDTDGSQPVDTASITSVIQGTFASLEILSSNSWEKRQIIHQAVDSDCLTQKEFVKMLSSIYGHQSIELWKAGFEGPKNVCQAVQLGRMREYAIGVMYALEKGLVPRIQPNEEWKAAVNVAKTKCHKESILSTREELELLAKRAQDGEIIVSEPFPIEKIVKSYVAYASKKPLHAVSLLGASLIQLFKGLRLKEKPVSETTLTDHDEDDLHFFGSEKG